MGKFIIDRFEDGFAVLEKEEGGTFDVPKNEINGAKEGDIVILKDGIYVVDEKETKKRKELIAEKMKRLFERK